MSSGEVFNQYGQYYDLLYKDKDYNAEAEYISKLIKLYAPAAKSILEFGSGTGKHGKLLAKMGYQVTGIEKSQEMVTKSQQTIISGFESIVGDVCTTTLEKKFEVVLALFHVISYLSLNEQLFAVFKNANIQLEKNGIFVFDVWYTPAVYRQRPEVRIKRMQDENWSIIRLAEPEVFCNRNIVEVNYTVLVKNRQNESISEIHEKHPLRHFSVPEIEWISQSTGFKIIKSEEFVTCKDLSEETWGACFVCKKI